MKKYEKPAVEVVEAFSSTDCMQLGLGSGTADSQGAPQRKENDDFDEEDW